MQIDLREGKSPNLFNGKRKEEHLRISLNEQVKYKESTTALESYYFCHQALPEMALADVDLSITLLGKRPSAPIIISSMVGGIQGATLINRNLAKAAAKNR